MTVFGAVGAYAKYCTSSCKSCKCKWSCQSSSKSRSRHRPDICTSAGSDDATTYVVTISLVTPPNAIIRPDVTSFASDDELNAVWNVWKYYYIVKDENTLGYINSLVKLKWNNILTGQQNNTSVCARVGQDATDLQRTTIKVRSVHAICNRRLLRRYQKKLCDVTKRHGLPSELKNRPIATEAIRPCVGPMTSLLTHQTTSASPHHLRCALETGETFLFHGTGKLQIDCIIRDGFNIKYAKRGMFGHPGIYLSEHAQKADQYTDGGETRRDTDLYMLVVRVALGKAEMYEKRKSNVKYDTIIGGENKLFREFVKGDAAQLYPQFLIRYDRK